jgi:tripartite-type tricarboxylate transporter receptor subunit TctC
MMMGGIGPHAINPALFPKLPYHAVRDFAPVIAVATAPNLLVANPALPARTVQDLVRLLKESQARPMNFGSNGTGSSTHLACEMFTSMAGVKATHIPYKGSAPMVTALLGNHVDIAFMSIVDILPHIKAGKIRALATAAVRRAEALPQVPTIAEAGMPGAESAAWFGVLVPAGTPREIVLKLNGDINRAMETPDLRKQLSHNGTELLGGTPEQFGEFIRAEIEKWTRVVKEAGVKPD